MSSNEIEHRPPAPTPARLGQATAVEQSRAMAEVEAQVVIAQRFPRDQQAALAAMRDTCGQMRLAEKAFFRYSRGGGTVTGPTVHLARELARIWGNITYGINELSRDDAHGQSEMLVFAWDLQTNTRPSQIFIVPHMRDKRGGAERLTDLRDIYEVNTNQGARRLRQAIWAVLPPWLVEEAEEICAATLREGGGVPLAKRISAAVDMFAGRGISAERLERRVERPRKDWTAHDVAQLGVIWKSLERGEIRIEEEFPQERVTAAELTGQAAAEQPAKTRGRGARQEPTDDPTAAQGFGEPLPVEDPPGGEA
jgi:hypothetical protein